MPCPVGVMTPCICTDSAFAEELASAAQQRSVEIAAFQKFFSGDAATIDSAVGAVASSSVHIMICIGFDTDMPAILDAAQWHGLLGDVSIASPRCSLGFRSR